MSATTLNRIIMLLACAGLFVAGTLTASHLLGGALPCTSGGGCAKVAADPSSTLLGAPVALYGVALYLILGGLAFGRSLLGLAESRPLVNFGLLLSALGTAASIGLQAYSFTVIKAKCDWCIASAVLMILLFLAHLMLARRPLAGPPSLRSDSLWLVAGLLLAGRAFAVQYNNLSQSVKPNIVTLESLKPSDVVKKEAYWTGASDAPIRIVEFADITCPACRSSFPKLRQMIETSKGKLRLGYQHFVFWQKEGHEMGLPAAMLAEYASQRGRFWQFLDAMYATSDKEFNKLSGVLGAASKGGLDPAEAKKLVTNTDSGLLSAVQSQIQFATELGVNQTPTFLVFANGLPNKAVGSFGDLTNLLETPPYQKLLKSDVPLR